MAENTTAAGSVSDNSQDALKLVICSWKNLGSDNKINFQAVADELGIASKAAAHKRFERLLKTFDLKPSDLTGKNSNTSSINRSTSQPLSTDDSTVPAATKRKRATKARGAAAEARTKRSKSAAVPINEDDEDPFVDHAADNDEQKRK
ncbi:hypothetical protein ACHAQH_006485 [Verticillium albo-atrum]